MFIVDLVLNGMALEFNEKQVKKIYKLVWYSRNIFKNRKSMVKSNYKDKIKKELEASNWFVSESEINQAWWNDESWKVTYKYEPKMCFIICFIVDPQFEETRKKGQGIYKVLATTVIPENWNDNSNEISSICMTKRKFDLKLNEFLKDLNKFKKQWRKEY